MEFRRVVIYSADVPATVYFYATVFGLVLLPISGLPLNDYSILNTGATLLVIQSFAMTDWDSFIHLNHNCPHMLTSGIELSFIVADVELTYAAALAAGASSLVPPHRTRWGQIVAYLRDANGVIISLIGACHEASLERIENVEL